MKVAHHVQEQGTAETAAPRSLTRLDLARLTLLPLSLILWAVGLTVTDTSHLGDYGLVAALSPISYLGLILLLGSAAIEFSRPSVSHTRLALHAVALVVILYGTAPLVYQDGRYSWLYKTIGVVRYVNAHGSLDRSIDIYQNWPGFFALAAWFDKVAGVSSPLAYAKWAQLVFELAAIPLLYKIYEALKLSPWHRWLAIMLYSGSNWIAQDYFSPQGLSTVLSLGIMAVVARWTLVASPTGWLGRLLKMDASGVDGEPDTAMAQVREAAPFIVTLVLLFFVLTATHELSPYIIAIQIGSLAVAGLLRPRWLALVVVGVTLAYLAPNFSYVNSHYGLISSLGKFFSNVQSPSATTVGSTPPESKKIIADSASLLSGGIWLLALAGAWLRRKRSRRTVLALVLLTFTPIIVLAAGAYGNEGILRVYLFSLPWAAALAAMAMRSPHAGEHGGSKHVEARHGTLTLALRAAVPLTLAVALFFLAFFGNDLSYVMEPSEVDTLTSFMETAQPGVMLAAIDNVPGSDTSNYNEWVSGSIFDPPGFVPSSDENPGIAAFLARSLVGYVGLKPAYVFVAPSMLAYNEAFGVTKPGNITMMLASLAKSRYWKLVVSQDGTVIYKMTAAVASIPPGPSSQNIVLGTP
jgi:hypothetical protein